MGHLLSNCVKKIVMSSEDNLKQIQIRHSLLLVNLPLTTFGQLNTESLKSILSVK
jgi:hypothetical protein